MLHTVFLALAVAAPGLKDKPKPAATLVGEWAIESSIVGGNPSQDNPNRWVFRADGTHAILNGGKALAEGPYTTDPKASPASLDLASGAQGEVYPCIFRLDGDVLTLNVGWQNSERPTQFESSAGSQCTLYVFKRVKKE